MVQPCPRGGPVNSNHIFVGSCAVHGDASRPGTCSLPTATDLTSQLTEATQVLKEDTSKLEEAKKAQQDPGQI